MGFDTAESFPSQPTLPGVDLASGTRIKQYELIRELGRGGMGVVYAARDIKLGRRVAMKFLRAVDREVLDRFLVEARATAQCNHDNIVIIYEVDEHEGMPYMVLEFLEGRSLRDLMGNDHAQPMPWSRVVELILPVARALARAHELGIVHRDLKPENVLVTTAAQVKVLDFGIAKALGSPESARSVPAADDVSESLTLTREGAMVGTLPYMSPEQMGVDEVDHRSDLFSLGMIMWEMLAGTHPIEMTSDALLQNLVTSTPMPSVRTAVGELPPGLVHVIDSCLAKAKQARLPSALELARQLEHLLPTRHARALAEGESPYPGLTAFQEHDADRFFGRGRDVTRMVARVRELPLTAIVGPSGVGKSSFVRAGVGPALKSSGETWDVITVRPGRYPLAALASVTERMITRPVGGGEAGDDHARMMRRLRAEPGYFGVALRARAKTTGGNVLLFVDQFEELYTLVADAEERRLFTAALSGVADDTAAPVRVVVSMRSDFLDRIAEDPRFMEELSRGLVFLSAPDREGLREALEAPVEMVGYRFESSAMVGDMLDALANTPGALPLLQFAAAKLWDARDRQGQLLTMASYQAIGGISGALATHADDVVRTMTTTQQRLTQRVFRQLVTPERTRAIVELSDLYAIDHNRDDIARVIDTLVAARLLLVQTRGDAGGGSVEIVHESLIDRWPTLKRWLDEDQEDAAFIAQLSAAAKQWDAKGRPAGMLWRGDQADEARRWDASSVRTLPPRDQAFIDAVLALGRRGRRARRIALVAVFSVLGAVAVGASVAYMQMRALRSEANESSVRATAEAQKATTALADAEAKRAEAEAQKKAAVEAQQAQKQTQTQLNATGEVLADREKQLVEQNDELKKQQATAVLAKEQAEAASKLAKAAAADAQRAKADLQVKLDDEKRKNKLLEDEKKKLSTKLKD